MPWNIFFRGTLPRFAVLVLLFLVPDIVDQRKIYIGGNVVV